MKSLDQFINLGLSELEIAERALVYRKKFEIFDAQYVDVIDVIEFKLPALFPGFRLIVRRDVELDYSAQASIDPPSIVVKESIYDAACEGDVDCRRILAHELGHMLLHAKASAPMQRDPSGYTPQFKNMNMLESAESQADVFARNFLIPPSIAFKLKHDALKLSQVTGTPKNIASAAITVSKRVEMAKIRSSDAKDKGMSPAPIATQSGRLS